MYNIFVAQRKQVDAHFYNCYKVYCNLRMHDNTEPARYLAIKVVDVAYHPEEDQLHIRDFINLLTEQDLPETRLRAVGRMTWETVMNFIEWIEEFDTYVPLYHWTTGKQVEVDNGLVWNTLKNHYYLLHVFQEEGTPEGVLYNPDSNTFVPIPRADPDPDLRDHHLNVHGGLDADLVPNGNQNQNPCCNPRPRRMGDDFKLTAISKLPKFDGETEGHKCPITFKIQTESAWEFMNGLATPQGGLMNDICEA